MKYVPTERAVTIRNQILWRKIETGEFPADISEFHFIAAGSDYELVGADGKAPHDLYHNAIAALVDAEFFKEYREII